MEGISFLISSTTVRLSSNSTLRHAVINIRLFLPSALCLGHPCGTYHWLVVVSLTNPWPRFYRVVRSLRIFPWISFVDVIINYDYKQLPDFFCNTSSFKRLNITSCCYNHTIVPPECTVSWTSLHKLSSRFCTLFDESMAKILSGCPVLEYLKLYHCGELNVLDLSQSPRLRTLEVIRNMTVRGPRQIVAPHIHCLRLYDPQLSSSTLVDVASVNFLCLIELWLQR